MMGTGGLSIVTLGGLSIGTLSGLSIGTLGGLSIGTLGGLSIGTLGGLSIGTLGGLSIGTLGERDNSFSRPEVRFGQCSLKCEVQCILVECVGHLLRYREQFSLLYALP